MTTKIEKTITAGKYLVSPLAKLTADGKFRASVSIKNGRNSGTHDRIFRFTPDFATHDVAIQYALAEGENWLQQHAAN